MLRIALLLQITVLAALLLGVQAAQAKCPEEPWNGSKASACQDDVDRVMAFVDQIVQAEGLLQEDPMEVGLYGDALEAYLGMCGEHARINGYWKELDEARKKGWSESKIGYRKYASRVQNAFDQGQESWGSLQTSYFDALSAIDADYQEKIDIVRNMINMLLEKFGNTDGTAEKLKGADLMSAVPFMVVDNAVSQYEDELLNTINNTDSSDLEVQQAQARLDELTAVYNDGLDRARKAGIIE